MDANLSFSTVTPLSAATAEPGQVLPAGSSETRGAEFANLFRSQLLNQEGQELAAPALADATLQLVSLGPQIDLITSAAPLLDLGSLAAFARAQGLDETAVQTLFGQQIPVMANVPTFGAVPVTTPVTLDIDSPTETTETDDLAQIDLSPDVLQGMDPALLVLMTAATATTTTTATAPVTSQIGLSPEKSNLPGLETSKSLTLPADVSLVSLQINTGFKEAPKTQANTPVTDLAQDAEQTAMQNAMRIRMELPSQEVTRRLSLMSGTAQQASWAALTTGVTTTAAADKALGTAWENLRIDVTSTPLSESQEDVEAIGLDLAPADSPVSGAMSASSERAANLTANTTSVSAPASQAALAEQRNAQSQQLADRLGQALAERLVAQIERGEWKLQLRMQPASLGQIDVQLDMHAGGLDASFMSDNSMTRELIAQGAGKLKDSLAESGMAVASVWVNGEQSRQPGGNPTPGRAFHGAANPAQKNVDEDVPVQRSAGIAVSSDGLDVLA